MSANRRIFERGVIPDVELPRLCNAPHSRGNSTLSALPGAMEEPRKAQDADGPLVASPAVREPFVGAGRNRRPSGIGERAGRQERPADVPVAARARQPDVAGTERVAQVQIVRAEIADICERNAR